MRVQLLISLLLFCSSHAQNPPSSPLLSMERSNSSEEKSLAPTPSPSPSPFSQFSIDPVEDPTLRNVLNSTIPQYSANIAPNPLFNICTPSSSANPSPSNTKPSSDNERLSVDMDVEDRSDSSEDTVVDEEDSHQEYSRHSSNPRSRSPSVDMDRQSDGVYTPRRFGDDMADDRDRDRDRDRSPRRDGYMSYRPDRNRSYDGRDSRDNFDAHGRRRSRWGDEGSPRRGSMSSGSSNTRGRLNRFHPYPDRGYPPPPRPGFNDNRGPPPRPSPPGRPPYSSSGRWDSRRPDSPPDDKYYRSRRFDEPPPPYRFSNDSDRNWGRGPSRSPVSPRLDGPPLPVQSGATLAQSQSRSPPPQDDRRHSGGNSGDRSGSVSSRYPVSPPSPPRVVAVSPASPPTLSSPRKQALNP
jgi:hypothetical protein